MTTSHDHLRTAPEASDQYREPTKKEMKAYTEFQTRIAKIRAELKKGGYLDLDLTAVSPSRKKLSPKK